MKRSFGISAAISSALFLGLMPIFGKQAILEGFSPFAVTSFRTTLAALLLLTIMLIFRRKYFYIYPVGLVGCVLAGFVNGIGSIFYYTALSRLSASIGHLLYSFYPLFVAFWLLLDRQTISKLTIIRLIIAVPGVYLLLSADNTHVDYIGAVFMLVSAAFYALHLIINQRVLYEVPAPTVTLYTLLSMSITTLLAYGLFDRQLPPAQAVWYPILGMGVLTFLSRLTLFWGVKHLGGMQTALLGLGELFVTIFLAQVWLHEKLSLLQWIGVAIVGITLILVGVDKFTKEKRQTSGLLAWLNPPKIPTSDFPWQPH